MAFFPLLFPHRFRRRAFVSRRLFYKTTIETVVLRTLYIYIYVHVYICTRTCVRSGIDNSGTTGEGKKGTRCSAHEGSERRRSQKASTKDKHDAKKLHRPLNLGRRCNRLINLQSARLILSAFNQPTTWSRRLSSTTIISFAEPTDTRRYNVTENEHKCWINLFSFL